MTASSAVRTQRFLDSLRAKWQDHSKRSPNPMTDRLRIGPWTIAAHYPGESLKSVFGPALAHHARLDGVERVDLEILCLDASEALMEIGAPPWTTADLGPMGIVEGLKETGLRALWDYRRRVIHALDIEAGFGVVIVADANNVPGWEQTFPFRNLLHWWAVQHDGVLIHGAAVAGDEGAMLMVGDSGAGKSTTSLSGSEAGLKLLGDDFVCVTFGAQPAVHSLYASAKLTADSTTRFDRLRDQMTYRIGDKHEKNIFFLDALGQQALIASAPLSQIAFLVQTGGPTTALADASAGAIFRHCAANTVALLPGDRARTLAALSKLSTAAPARELQLGHSSQEVGAFLRRTLDKQAA